MHETQISRRDIFKLLAAASALGASTTGAAARPADSLTQSFGDPMLDPNWNQPVTPWTKPLVESELATLAVLVDLILPADDESPAASKIGVHDFLNEWVGAPYPENREDYEILRGGIAWINTHAWQLHGKTFTALAAAQQTAILDTICDPAKTDPELAAGARFFQKLRMLTLGGYYTHPSTWKQLGYAGNVPIAGPYPGVPDEIIRILGLEGL